MRLLENKANMKKYLLKDATVVFKRAPLFETTNTLKMPKSNAEVKALGNKDVCDKVDGSVPYSKTTQLSNKENIYLTKNKDITTRTIGKRIRKKPSCPCCTNEVTSKSAKLSCEKETTSSMISSGKSIDITESANEKVYKRVCHDSKFSSKSKIMVDRPNTQNFLKESRQKEDNDQNIETNRENIYLTKSKDTTSIANDKRVRKKPSRCSCCINESSSKSANISDEKETISSSSTISSRESIDNIESANEKVDNKVCHDPKFSMKCKIIIERLDIHNVSKETHDQSIEKKDLPKVKFMDQNVLLTKNELQVQKIPPTQQMNQREASVFVPPKLLRRQVKPNYAEITLNSSKEDTPKTLTERKHNYATKVPVYRQKLEEENLKKPEKIYEFDESDSDYNPHRKKGKRFGKRTKVNSPPYHIFETGNVKRGKEKIKRTRKPKLKEPVKKYNDIMQEVMQKVIKKVVQGSDVVAVVDKVKESEKNKPREDTKTNNINNNIGQLPKTVSMLPNIVTLGEHHQSVKKTGANQNIFTVDVSDGQLNVTTDDQSRSMFERTEERVDLHTRKTVTETAKGDISSRTNTSPGYLHPSEEVIAGSIDDDNGNLSEEEDDLDGSFLDFGGNFHSTPINNASKINVISNVLLKGSSSNRKKISNEHKHNPWRFNEAVRRNPHFILLKNTALPCLKQDMVLDHNQVEKIEEHFSKTPRRIGTPTKSPVQKSILDYVNNPNRHDKENIPRSSLFDYDDFSPIKSKTPQINKPPDKAKRNILGSIQDNAANIMPFTSTPTNPNSVRRSFIREDEDEDIANCFGFDEIDNTIPTDKGKTSEAMPFRIKRYASRKQKVQVDEVEELPLEQPEPDESQIASNSMEGHLFDDLEEPLPLAEPSKIYVRKPRRKRLKSVEVEDDEEYPVKRKKKDMMTKAEEAALEDWAAKFNSMCREIEKYNLEIE